jgi:hypothetical protein
LGTAGTPIAPLYRGKTGAQKQAVLLLAGKTKKRLNTRALMLPQNARQKAKSFCFFLQKEALSCE